VIPLAGQLVVLPVVDGHRVVPQAVAGLQEALPAVLGRREVLQQDRLEVLQVAAGPRAALQAMPGPPPKAAVDPAATVVAGHLRAETVDTAAAGNPFPYAVINLSIIL